jgi:hypothetical protein
MEELQMKRSFPETMSVFQLRKQMIWNPYLKKGEYFEGRSVSNGLLRARRLNGDVSNMSDGLFNFIRDEVKPITQAAKTMYKLLPVR